MRKLASIQQISEIKPIPDADAIELAQILGWQCVVKKGEFKPGDCCVYFEVDSFLPIEDRYEFLRKNCFRKNELLGEGFRIKTITLRGEISQGLVLPLEKFSNLANLKAGDDVTDLLGVRKWELPEQAMSDGTAVGEKPYGIPTTDETRIQSAPELLPEFEGKPYYISTKMDGTSCTVYVKDGIVGVCGRNYEYKDDGKCSMWKWVHDRNLVDKLKGFGQNIAVQGEFCGAGIQKNRLKLQKPELYVFTVLKLGDDNKTARVGLDEMREICARLELTTVPIEEEGENFSYSLPELLERAKGRYSSGMDKEGIVIRPITPGRLGYQALSFKVINNDFLKKEKD